MFSRRRIVFTLILMPLLLVSCRVVWAQETSANNQQVDSEEEMLSKVEKDIQSLYQPVIWDETNLAPRLYKQLKTILQVYPNTLSRERIEEALAKVQELLATHDLYVARFYVSRAEHGDGGTKGAQARLRMITREFPNFSRMDEVFFLFGKVFLIEDRTEDAANSFWKLIYKYPYSSFVNQAFEQLNQMGYSAVGDCDNLKP